MCGPRQLISRDILAGYTALALKGHALILLWLIAFGKDSCNEIRWAALPVQITHSRRLVIRFHYESARAPVAV